MYYNICIKKQKKNHIFYDYVGTVPVFVFGLCYELKVPLKFLITRV